MNRIQGGFGALLGVALYALLPQQARALPILSEVFYDAAGSDNGKSFVEIYADDSKLMRSLKRSSDRLQSFGKSIVGIGL